MPKPRPQKKKLSWLARTAIKTGRLVPKRIQIGEELMWPKVHRRKTGLKVPIGRRRKGQYSKGQAEAQFVVTKTNPNRTRHSTTIYNREGKLVSVSYPRGSLESTGRSVSRMRKKPTQELIERKAQREAKKWFLETRDKSNSRAYIKGRKSRWIREQAVGMALREVGIFSKSIRAKVHNLYTGLLEYETFEIPSKPMVPGEETRAKAKEQLKKLLGGKFTRFQKARSRYSGRLRTALRKAEKEIIKKEEKRLSKK